MWMARSSSRRPQPDGGSACSQSLLWGDVTDSSRALSVALLRLLITVCLLEQWLPCPTLTVYCCWTCVTVGDVGCRPHVSTMDTKASVVPAIEQRSNSCCWSVSVAAPKLEKQKMPAKKRDAHSASHLSRVSWPGATGDPWGKGCKWCRCLFLVGCGTSRDMGG